MAPQDASGEGFTVRDRRGQGAEPEPPRPPRARSSSEPDKAAASPPSREVVGFGPSDLPAEPDLAALVVLLANSAMLHLGEVPETMTGAPVDLAQAKFSIDLLRLLKEKTEGNRTPEESRLLEAVLYDLQMRFVRAARRD